MDNYHTSKRLNQGLHTSKLCARFMLVNILISVNSLEAESESKNGMNE